VLAPITPEPAPPARSARMAEIVDVGLTLLESEGPDALTMRRIADAMGIRAASLYKHLPNKGALETALVEIALREVGAALHGALAALGPDAAGWAAVTALLGAYRTATAAHPNLYRLATSGPIDRAALTPTLEDWAGEPFLLATGDPYRGQALWSAAHGLVILALDGRFPAGTDLDRTWRALAESFGATAR